MKGSDGFKNAISGYLKQLATKDELFAETLKKPNKNIDGCITYILNQVSKSGCNGFEDVEIYNMAVHFYDEDDLKPGKKIQTRVVVNHVVEFSEEDKEKAKKEAFDKLVLEEQQKLKRVKSKKVEVVDHVVELSEQDKEKAKKEAFDKLVLVEQQKLKRVKPKKIEVVEQVSLFDAL